MPNMKSWSDARLEKELAFARSFDIQTPEALNWMLELGRENQRRDLGGCLDCGDTIPADSTAYCERHEIARNPD